MLKQTIPALERMTKRKTTKNLATIADLHFNEAPTSDRTRRLLGRTTQVSITRLLTVLGNLLNASVVHYTNHRPAVQCPALSSVTRGISLENYGVG